MTMKNIWTLEDCKYYIAGLFEGDGHILIPAADIKKKTLPRWHITAHVKDLPCIEHLHKLFGHGFIRHKPLDNAVVWTIGNQAGLLKMIDWLNGRLYTPKLIKFNQMIDWLTLERGVIIEKLHLKDASLNNAWFSGFVDADGGFYIRATKGSDESSKKKERIAARMTIDQRIISADGESYFSIMNLIKETFNCSLTEIQKSSGSTYYHLRADNANSLNLLNKYFEKYPLISSKYLDYLCWKDVILIKGHKNILSDQDKKNILTLKSQMNSNRKFFSWQHLPDVVGTAV